jgi:sensor histidine kinase YesM
MENRYDEVKTTLKGRWANRGVANVLIYPFKKVWHYVLAALGVGALFNLLLWPSIFETWSGAILGALWSASHWVSQSMGNGFIVYKIEQRISWLERPWFRALVGFISMLLYSVTAFVIVQSFFMFFVQGQLPNDFLSFLILSSKIAVGISFSISLILTTIGFLRGWKQSSTEAERLKTEMMSYKYESLRNQVNPHFLFNSLNVLSDLVYEDQNQAVKFIRQLSDLYRYVLDNGEREVVPLQEELDFIDSFGYLLKIRFEDKLQLTVDVTSSPDERIVPMSLQNLLENAVKHNEVSSQFPLHVKIIREGDRILVTNALRKINVGEDSKMTGLKNIRARYEVLSDEALIVTEENGDFTVSLPILKEETV